VFLHIDGGQLAGPIFNGPVFCEDGSPLQCNQPNRANRLHITPAPSGAVLPTLTSILPSDGAASGGTGVTLTGTDLLGATAVTFDGTAATSVNVVNATTVTAVTPAHAAGAVDVVVTTPLGDGTLTGGYTYSTTAIGQPAFGGVIGCLNGGAFNNLIAATADISASIIWGSDTILTGASSTTDGASNTATIVGTFGEPTPNAATLCNDYEVDSQGNTPCEAGNACYNDWFLPAGNNNTTSGQLFCLYTNRVAIGGFSQAGFPNNYWSSTEVLALFGYTQRFAGGSQTNENKTNTYPVRCVSEFTP